MGNNLKMFPKLFILPGDGTNDMKCDEYAQTVVF